MAWKSAIKAVPLAHLDAPYSYGGMGYPEHTGAFPFPSPLGDGVTSLFLAEVMFKLEAGTICWRPEGRFKQICKVHPYPAVFLWHPTTRPYFLSKRGKYQEISLQRQHWEKGTHSELQHPELLCPGTLWTKGWEPRWPAGSRGSSKALRLTSG